MRYLMREYNREPVAQNWTKQPPRSEGYYWFRATIRESASILEVRRNAAGQFQYLRPSIGWNALPVGEWFGPLEEPGGCTIEDFNAKHKPDVLFDAIVRVVGIDPKATWPRLDKVQKQLLSAKPPYEVAEVMAFAERLPELLPRHKGQVTLELLEKHIGKVRAKAREEVAAVAS